MGKSELDIGQTLARMSALTIFELRNEWLRLHRADPPMRLSRDLLTRGIGYKLQERAYGGLPKSVLRRLAGLAGRTPEQTATMAAAAAPLALKPGTRLVREWRGETHFVLVHADGVEWRGQRFASLSIVAKQITGAHWSGPRFFGLIRRLSPTQREPSDDALRGDN
jgi:hypothetical protein